MDFFKKLSVSTLSLAMLFANVKAAPTENTICYWNLNSCGKTINFDYSKEYGCIFCINNHGLNSLLGKAICIETINSLDIYFIYNNLVYKATLDKQSNQLLSKEILEDTYSEWFSKLPLSKQQEFIKRFAKSLTKSNLYMPLYWRTLNFKEFRKLIDIENSNFKNISSEKTNSKFISYIQYLNQTLDSLEYNIQQMTGSSEEHICDKIEKELISIKDCIFEYYDTQNKFLSEPGR